MMCKKYKKYMKEVETLSVDTESYLNSPRYCKYHGEAGVR